MKKVRIKGMTCQHCVIAVTRALAAVDGIKNVQVDLKTGIATYDETKPVLAAAIADAIQKAGYEVVG